MRQVEFVPFRLTDVRDRLRDMFYAFLCYGGTQNAVHSELFSIPP